jgi:gamma-butyrobetaine dioxygenase
MTIEAMALEPRTLHIRWADGGEARYPYLFLRDNDPAGFHPQTKERQIDLLAVPEDLAAQSARIESDALVLDWAGDGSSTAIPLAWLDRHRPGRRNADAADIEAETWSADYLGRIERHAAGSLLEDDASLLAFLKATKRTGLAVVTNLTDDEKAGIAIGERIGFLRRTNFGLTFRVETMPDPNNLAYTSHALPLHTDLPNQELPPGYQFLHCVRNGATGGASTFVDAYRVAERVRDKDRAAFDLLASIPVPYRFHDKAVDIRVHRPIISLDERGRVFDVRYSAHLLDAFDMPAETMVAYYRAFRLLMAETRNPEHFIAFKMEPGQMVAFDNRRVLHGRTAFDPQSGHRLLVGFYVDRGEFDSRIRKIAAV